MYSMKGVDTLGYIRNLNILQILGAALMITAGIYILLSSIKILKESMNEKRNDILNKRLKFYKKVDKLLIEKIHILNKVKKSLQLKYGVISSSTEGRNNIKAIKTIINLTVVSLIIIIGFSFIIRIWYLIIPISIGVIFFPYILLFAVLNLKLGQLHDQFPNALNIFFTKYTSEKNKDVALKKTYPELSNPIRYEFRRLSTTMANKSLENVVSAVNSFCKRVNYIWADVLGDLLILNHTTVNNIGEELNELNLLMIQDQSIEADKKAETNSNKIVNFLVAGFVVLAVIFNIIFLKHQAINIYFQTYQGIMAISLSVLVVVACLSLTVYFEKS